jgi:two-component system response regulator HydG
VRELENVIERAIVIGQGPEVMARSLPFFERAQPVPGDLPRALEEVEKAHIGKMLEIHNWNVSKAAKVLDIDRTTLHKKIQKFGLART